MQSTVRSRVRTKIFYFYRWCILINIDFKAVCNRPEPTRYYFYQMTFTSFTKFKDKVLEFSKCEQSKEFTLNNFHIDFDDIFSIDSNDLEKGCKCISFFDLFNFLDNLDNIMLT